MRGSDFRLDVIGIGSPRCGTTWLAECLAAHPELDFCKYKEPNHFLRREFVKELYDARSSMLFIHSGEEFRRCFENNGRQRGEFSVFYIYDEASLRAIKDHNPDVRLVLALRDPVDAAYSNYSYNTGARQRRDDLASSFLCALGRDREHRFLYSYSERVSRLYRLFPRENVHIVLFDDIDAKPAQTLRDLYSFIGIDPGFEAPGAHEAVHPAKRVRSMLLANVAKPGSVLLARAGLKKPLVLAYRWYDRLNKSPLQRPPLSFAQRSEAAQVFAADIVDLEQITGLRLDTWKVS